MRYTGLRRWFVGAAVLSAGLLLTAGCGKKPADEGPAGNPDANEAPATVQDAGDLTDEQLAAWDTEYDQFTVTVDETAAVTGLMAFNATDGYIGKERESFLFCADDSVKAFDKENPDSDVVHAAEMPFEVASEGRWYMWALVWWPDDCGNSVKIGVKDAEGSWVQEPFMVADATTKTWHWVKASPRGVELQPGSYSIVIVNNEDGARLNSLLFDTRPVFTPANPGS